MLIDDFTKAVAPYIDANKIKTILDIGSRDLEQSLEMHTVYPNAHIHAFEPNPESYEKCKAKAPGYVTVHPYAVLDYDGETSFYSVIQKDNHGASSVFEPTDQVVGVNMAGGVDKINVLCRRIDDWAREQNIDKIDVVWMDVQGTELPTLWGFGRLLETVKAIATEVETGALYYPNRKYQPTQYGELKEFLESRGFEQIYFNQPWPLECDTSWIRSSLSGH